MKNLVALPLLALLLAAPIAVADTVVCVGCAGVDPILSQTVSNKTIDNTNTVTVKDANLTIQDEGDTTKQVKFQLSGITAGQTRTVTPPDSNTTIPIFSQVVTFSGPTAPRTVTLPDSNFAVPGLGTANAWTNSQTFGTGGTALQLLKTQTCSVDPPNIAAAGSGSQTCTVTGVATTDSVLCNFTAALHDDLSPKGCYVSAANTVTFVFYNENESGGGAIDDAAISWNVLWFDLTP